VTGYAGGKISACCVVSEVPDCAFSGPRGPAVERPCEVRETGVGTASRDLDQGNEVKRKANDTLESFFRRSLSKVTFERKLARVS